MGVDLFFVLSGYLIGSGLLAEIKGTNSLNVPRFYLKRALKIWPSYIALLLFLSVGLTLPTHDRSVLIPNVLHLQNYLGTVRTHTWSLAVEEHFYVLLPLLLVLLCKRLHLFTVVMAVIAVACLVGRCIVTDPYYAMYVTHLRIDSLFFGVFIAYLTAFKPEVMNKLVTKPRVLMLLGFLLVLPVMLFDLEKVKFVSSLGLTLNYIGFGLIMVAMLHTNEPDGILGRILFGRLGRCIAWIGFFSYGIYLWHIDFGLIPAKVEYIVTGHSMPPELGWLYSMTLFIGFAVGAGALMSRMIEIPVLRARDSLMDKCFGGKATEKKFPT